MIDWPTVIVAFCVLGLVALVLFELSRARRAALDASRRLHLLHKLNDEGDLPYVTWVNKDRDTIWRVPIDKSGAP